MIVMSMCFTKMQPLNPLRQLDMLQSLCQFSECKSLTHPVLVLYSDGGPNHRVTYTSVKLALIALLELNLDYLIAARTVPYHFF